MSDPLLDCLDGGKEARYLGLAIEAIKNHPFKDEVKSIHGAVLVRGGSILACGINKPKRNVFVDIHAVHDKATIHAECDVILQARNRTNLRGSTIYVARLLKFDGSIAMSRPCPSCIRICAKYGIKKVYYTTEEGFDILRRSQMTF